MTEAQFKETLDPAMIVRHRRTSGGPQPEEMQRMIASAKADLAAQEAWIKARRSHIDDSLAKLDQDFAALLRS